MENINQIDWDFIGELEGKGIGEGYVPSDNSGVTIGTGVDLKEKNEEYFKKIGVSLPIIEKIKPFFTLKGAEASEVASNLKLEDNEVLELDTAVKKDYANKIRLKYEEATGKPFTNLSSAQQTVIVSVGFQYGSFERTPSFWKAVVADDWKTVESELRNFGDNYSTRRIKEADLLSVLKKKPKQDKKDLKAPTQIEEDLNPLQADIQLDSPEEKKIPNKYRSPQNAWNQKEQGGELYLDRVFKTYQNYNNARKEATFGEGVVAAVSENQIIPALLRILTAPSFKPDDKWSLNQNMDFVKEQWDKEGISSEFYDEFTGVASEEHFMFTLEKVKKHQQNKQILESMGWTGVGLEVGAFILDPASWTGYGVAAKILKPVVMATSLTRRQKFVRTGLVYAATEATVFAPVAYESPTYGTSDVIISAALGGTLGGGISTIFAKNLNNIAKAEMLMDIQENGQKLTTRGEKEFKKVMKPFNTKPLKETEDFVNGQVGDLLPPNRNRIIYHGTNKNFKEFDVNKTADKSIWFTDDINVIKKGTSGATGKGIIMSRILDEDKLKLASSKQADKLSDDQLIAQGYDGVKLEKSAGYAENNYRIFNPEKLDKIEKTIEQQIADVKKKNAEIYKAERARNDIDSKRGSKFHTNTRKEVKKLDPDANNIDINNAIALQLSARTNKILNLGIEELKKLETKLNKLKDGNVITSDTSVIKDIGLVFGRLRDAPFLGLFPFNRSGALGTSESELVRLFNYIGQEEPVAYAFKTGAKKGQIAPQADTIELMKNAILQGGHNLVYKEVNPAVKAYLKEQGHGTLVGFFKLSVKNEFMTQVARTIRSKKPSDNVHINTAANAYRDGFRFMVDQIKKSGIEGSDKLKYFDQYLPRKVSQERFGELQNKIGFEGIVELLRGAIEGKVVNKILDVGSTRQTTTKIEKDKAYKLARWIAKSIQMSQRSSGFDLEQLVKIKDPAKLKEYIDDAFDHLNDAQRAELVAGLKSEDLKLLTSGRLEERLRLNELYETTINGQRVRLDDLLENNVDVLWHGYMNEMSGWAAIGERTGIKNRTELVKYQNKLNNSIDEAYKDKNARSRYITKNSWIATEEKDTIDSFFKNVLGRSAETDPTDMMSTSLRQLRKYNFMRVLNQVGVAQLPEFGISTAQQGLGTLIQEIPHFKKLLVKAQKGELDDTFFEDFAVANSTNGTEFWSRAHTNYEIEDLGGTAIGKAHDMSRKNKLLQLGNLGERATGFISGLFLVDSFQRRLTMRVFVNRMAKDLIDVAEGGTQLHKLKGRLNRYRVLGFTDEELLAIGKEFSGKNVITEKTFWGRRVKHFNFANWKDQDLVFTLGRRVNRYTQRAVQYNYLGDTNRFFTDKAFGKSMSQFRSFIMTAWSKQFLHNIAMADQQAFATFMYTTFIASLAYIGQTQMNAVGMGKTQKKKYMRSKLGNWKKGDYSKLAMASLQRSGWSSLIPTYADIFLSNLSPDNRFNFRTSGLEVNLYTGNPTYDLLTSGVAKTFGAMLKATRDDYQFSKTDINRMMRLLPFQNMYGINNIINFLNDKSGLPKKGSTSNL